MNDYPIERRMNDYPVERSVLACPKDPTHVRFRAQATVVENWIVDPEGNYVESTGTGDVVDDPDLNEYSVCNECGADALVGDDAREFLRKHQQKEATMTTTTDEKSGRRQARPIGLEDRNELERIAKAYIAEFGTGICAAIKPAGVHRFLGMHGEDATVHVFTQDRDDDAVLSLRLAETFDPRWALDLSSGEMDDHITWLAEKLRVSEQGVVQRMFDAKICDVRAAYGVGRQPIAVCPADPSHRRFVTVATVMEDWVVDQYGEFEDQAGETLQTVHKPDVRNEWTCHICSTQVLTGEKAAEFLREQGTKKAETCASGHKPDWHKAEFADSLPGNGDGCIVTVPCSRCDCDEEASILISDNMITWSDDTIAKFAKETT